MEKENDREIRLIICDPIGRNNYTMLNVINHGIFKEGLLEFTTKQGEQLMTIAEIEKLSLIKVIKEKDVDFETSIVDWFADPGNFIHYGKKLIFDKTITEGALFKGMCWRYSLMLKVENEIIKYRPVWD